MTEAENDRIDIDGLVPAERGGFRPVQYGVTHSNSVSFGSSPTPAATSHTPGRIDVLEPAARDPEIDELLCRPVGRYSKAFFWNEQIGGLDVSVVCELDCRGPQAVKKVAAQDDFAPAWDNCLMELSEFRDGECLAASSA